jgi:hypothetical protein
VANTNIFKLRPSAEVVAERGSTLGAAGVYFVFFDALEGLLHRSGYYHFNPDRPYSQEGYELLYVGASVDPLSRRVLEHLNGNTKGSSLRMTVGALMSSELGLEPVTTPRRTYFDFGSDGEARLTDWMLAHTRVATAASAQPYADERELLTTIPLPFNISERRRHPFSKYLMAQRAVMAGKARALQAVPRVGRGGFSSERFADAPAV